MATPIKLYYANDLVAQFCTLDHAVTYMRGAFELLGWWDAESVRVIYRRHGEQVTLWNGAVDPADGVLMHDTMRTRRVAFLNR